MNLLLNNNNLNKKKNKFNQFNKLMKKNKKPLKLKSKINNLQVQKNN